MKLRLWYVSLIVFIFFIFNHNLILSAKESPKKNIVNIKKITDKKPSAPMFEYEEPKEPQFTNPYIALLRGIGSLIIILILIYVTIYVLKFLYKGKHLPGIKNFTSDIRILDQIILQPGKALQIVEIYGNILLLGITEAGINVIKEFTDKETIEKIKNSKIESSSLQFNLFKEYLNKFTKSLQPKTQSPGTTQTYNRTSGIYKKQNTIDYEKLRKSKENILHELQRIKELREKET